MNKEMQNYVSLKLSNDLVEEAIDNDSFEKVNTKKPRDKKHII